MNTDDEPAPMADPEAPESWSQHRPVPRRKSISPFRATILVGALFTTIIFSVWAVMRISREPTIGPATKSIIQPRVRWEYHTETIKAEDLMRDSDGKYASEKYAEAQRSRNRFYFIGSPIDRLGEAGWELVGVVPNTETVFASVEEGVLNRVQRTLPNTRVAEIILLFKRPSPYKPWNDEQIREQDERARRYEQERAGKKKE